jgi:peptide/nickel transport system substrate-binding protein
MHKRVSPGSWSSLRRRAFLGLAAAVLIGAALPGSAAGSSRALAAKPVLRFGSLASWGTWDPTTSSEYQVFNLLYAPFIQIGANAKPIFKDDHARGVAAGLATSFRNLKVAHHGPNRDFELTLRRDARFSEGTPVTAPAVVRWLKYFLSKVPSTAASFGPNSFQAVGKWTVQIHLQTPNPDIKTALSSPTSFLAMAASPRAVADPSLFATKSYGAGPYMIDPSRSVSGDHYTLVPNPYYYDKPALKFREVDVKIIASDTSELQAIEAGQIDAGLIGDPTLVKSATGAGLGVTLIPTPGDNTLYLMSLKKPPLSDVRVRQALNYAIDRKTLSKSILLGVDKPTETFFTTDGFDKKYDSYYSYNPKKAKALLAAAGYPNGFTLTAESIGYIPLIGDDLVRAVSQYLDAVGVHLTIHAASDINDLIAGLGKYDLWQSNAGGIPMSEAYLGYFLPGQGFLSTLTGLNDPTLNGLYSAALKSRHPGPYWKKMSLRILKQAYFLVLAFNGQWLVHSKKYVVPHDCCSYFDLKLVAPAVK